MKVSGLKPGIGWLLVLQLSVSSLAGQELYVFTEPASNMPAKSISAKYNLRLQKGYYSIQT